MKTEDYKRLTYNENDGLKEETIRRLTFDGSEDWKQNKLSEEEIIEECNKLFVTMANVHIDGKAMADLLDLYKQEKEKNKELEAKQCVYQDTSSCRRTLSFETYTKLENYISKDKIKAKIEELEKIQVLHSRYGEIKVLQELLKEEN